MLGLAVVPSCFGVAAMPLWVFEIETLHAMRRDAIHVHSHSANQFRADLRAETLAIIREIETEMAARSQPFQPYEG
jgi:hypothetical protein